MERLNISLLALFLLPIVLGIVATFAQIYINDRIKQIEHKELVWRHKRFPLTLLLVAALTVIGALTAIIVGYGPQDTIQVETPRRREPTVSKPKEPGLLSKLRDNPNNPPPVLSSIAYKQSDLIDTILAQQKAHVRDSIGLWAQDCFTDADLQDFIVENAVQEIVDSLKSDQQFLNVVASIISMPISEQQELLQKGSRTYKKTWTQLGLNPKKDGPEKLRMGQTDAGQTAERLIAEGIVSLVESLLRG